MTSALNPPVTDVAAQPRGVENGVHRPVLAQGPGHRRLQIGARFQVEGPGEVVAGSGRDDPQHGGGARDRLKGQMHGAVAPHRHQPVGPLG